MLGVARRRTSDPPVAVERTVKSFFVPYHHARTSTAPGSTTTTTSSSSASRTAAPPNSELPLVASGSSPSTPSCPRVSWVTHLPLPSIAWHVSTHRTRTIRVFAAPAVLRRSLKISAVCVPAVARPCVPALRVPPSCILLATLSRSHAARMPQPPWPHGKFVHCLSLLSSTHTRLAFREFVCSCSSVCKRATTTALPCTSRRPDAALHRKTPPSSSSPPAPVISVLSRPKARPSGPGSKGARRLSQYTHSPLAHWLARLFPT